MKNQKSNFKDEYLRLDTYNLVTMAMLVAIQIIFSRFLSIQAYNIRIGFSFMALAMAGMLLGPVRAGLVGFAADILGLFLFSGSTFNPGITFTTTCVGILFGVFLYKKPTVARCIIAVAIHQLFFSLVLNSLWLAMMYDTTLTAMMLSRLPQAAFMLPVEMATVIFICNRKTVNMLYYNMVAGK